MTRDTSSAWLRGLQSRDEAAWQRLTRDYGPLLYAWCRGFGLPAESAGDVIQDVLRTVAARVAALEHQGPGSFRAWLRAVTRSRVMDHFRRAEEAAAVGGSEALRRLEQLPERLAEEEEAGEQALLLRGVLDRLRGDYSENTWRAFWRVTVEGHAAAEVGQDLGMTAEAVRQCKARILRRLRSELDNHPDGVSQE